MGVVPSACACWMGLCSVRNAFSGSLARVSLCMGPDLALAGRSSHPPPPHLPCSVQESHIQELEHSVQLIMETSSKSIQ